MKIAKVIAQDWALYDGSYELGHPFKVTLGEVVGFLVQEDDEKVVLSHHYFPRSEATDDVRRTTVIPKGMIIGEIKILEERSAKSKRQR